MDADPMFPGHGLPPDLPEGAGHPIVHLSEFLRSPPGRYVLQWEQQHLDHAVADIFGYHALQLGLPEIDALRENRMPLRLCAADRRLEVGAGDSQCQVAVINRYEELPFASQSIDLVVMPHILEFAEEPHQVLREVDRVLVPEGHVVITGFNPASLWGLRQLLTRLGAAPYLPREGQFISLPRIKDWLKLLSFEVNRGRFGCYVPSVRTDKWLGRFNFMERAGDRWWPVLGSLYMVTAVKRVRGMRIVGKLRKKREELRVLVPAASPSFSPTPSPQYVPDREAVSVRVAGGADSANDETRSRARG